MNAQQNLKDFIDAAIEADAKSVPVNWKDVSIIVFNASIKRIADIEKQLEEKVEVPLFTGDDVPLEAYEDSNNA